MGATYNLIVELRKSIEEDLKRLVSDKEYIPEERYQTLTDKLEKMKTRLDEWVNEMA
jgi:hypothetical protein